MMHVQEIFATEHILTSLLDGTYDSGETVLAALLNRNNMKPVRSFLKFSWSEKWAVIQASVLLIVFKLLIRYSKVQTYGDWALRMATSRRKSYQIDAHRIGRFVDQIGNRLGMNCYPKAMTTFVLVRRRGLDAEIQIGIRKNDQNELVGHAWVLSEGQVVVGDEPDLPHYRVMLQLRDSIETATSAAPVATDG